MKLYEYDCLNCGKHHIIPASSSAEPKFCDRECWRQYNKKKLDAAEKAKEEARKKRKTRMSGIVPQKMCRKCRYGMEVGGIIGCDYVFQTGQSRVFLHPDGIPSKCEEYKPRARARRGKAGAVNG